MRPDGARRLVVGDLRRGPVPPARGGRGPGGAGHQLPPPRLGAVRRGAGHRRGRPHRAGRRPGAGPGQRHPRHRGLRRARPSSCTGWTAWPSWPTGGTSVVLVHALNPHGFAHRRRVNEDNVDLNRNFVDHAGPPDDRDYDVVHPLLVPKDWDGPAHAAADAELAELVGSGGSASCSRPSPGASGATPTGCSTAATGRCGPTRHGGRSWPGRWSATATSPTSTCTPAWASEAMPSRCSAVGATPVPTTEPGAGTATPSRGPTTAPPARRPSWATPRPPWPTASGAGDETLTAITLEVGTRSAFYVLGALRADNWCHVHGDPAPALRRPRR